MSICGKNFIYNKRSLEEFGDYFLCTFNNGASNESSGLLREINRGEITPTRSSPNFYSTRYSDVFSYSLDLAKNDQKPFTQEEIRRLNAWLTSPKTPRTFTIIDGGLDTTHFDLEYSGIFTDVSYIKPHSRVIGLTYTFVCDAPYPYSREYSYPFESAEMADIFIDNLTDELEEELFPLIEIKAKKSGIVTITNQSHPDAFKASMVLNMRSDQKLIINNENNIITDNLGLLDYDNDFNFVWLALVPGCNHITITGSCEGTIKCRYPRKVVI